MSMEYKILWVDDSQDWVRPVKDNITSHLEGKSYEPKIELKKSGAEVDTSKLSDIDLIIIDYQLPGDNGDELIKQVRDKECLTQIVFYSQGIIESDERLYGVHYSTREDVEECIEKVVNETIERAQDITLVRGFIIAEAIDVENILEECMAKIFEDKGELFLEKVINAKPPVYDANKKYRFVKEIVSGLVKEGTGRLEELREIDKTMKKLTEEVFNQRNILAHSKITINDDGTTRLEGINKETKEINFSREWLSRTRKDIAKHKDNLNKLKEIL